MLEPFVPQFATVQNPLDLTAGFGQDTERFGRIVRLVAEDPAVEVIAIALAATSGKVAEQFAACLAGLKSTLPVPLFVAWNARAADVGQAYDILEEAGIPRFCTPARCARAIEAAATFAATQRRFRMAAAAPTRAIAPASARPRQTIRTLSEFEAKGLLQTARIPITIETLACSREEAILAAATLNGPAVMKIQSPDLPHKTEIGGVRMGVQGSEKVGFAYEELVGSARLHAPRARIDGVLIQEYVSGAAELIVGTSFSNEFGASILVGMGGIYSEVLNDVAVRLLPVDRQEVLSMLQETKVFRILQGVRGQPAADVDALVDVILRVADLALELGGSLDSLEINPLFVRARGKGVVAGDALASLYEDDRTVKRQVIAA